ncbi:MAG TPA: hypothetical protein VEB21_02715 [Terriglobales bacterium]|nr:hypothetical protein [Terriglobales bacterium]
MQLSRFVGAICFGFLTVSTAYGLDAQGTWAGKVTCKHFDGDKGKSVYENFILKITQTGTTIYADLDGGDYRYFGTAIPSIKDAEVGEIGITLCQTGDSDAEVARLALKNDRLKGESIYRWSGSNENCTWKFVRISTADPLVGPCP